MARRLQQGADAVTAPADVVLPLDAGGAGDVRRIVASAVEAPGRHARAAASGRGGQEVRAAAPNGGAVVVVSDGLVEAPARPLAAGADVLPAAADAAGLGVEVPCHRPVARLGGDGRPDDVCVLTVRRR